MKTVLILTLISLFLHADTFIPPKAKDVAIKINAFAREFTIVLQPEEKYRFTSGFEVIY